MSEALDTLECVPSALDAGVIEVDELGAPHGVLGLGGLSRQAVFRIVSYFL